LHSIDSYFINNSTSVSWELVWWFGFYEIGEAKAKNYVWRLRGESRE
jgi:hypothetical protein